MFHGCFHVVGGDRQALRAQPGSEWLARQQMLLPYAKILTIDAFCSSLVKEHFALLPLSPAFRTADEGELHLLTLPDAVPAGSRLC